MEGHRDERMDKWRDIWTHRWVDDDWLNKLVNG